MAPLFGTHWAPKSSMTSDLRRTSLVSLTLPFSATATVGFGVLLEIPGMRMLWSTSGPLVVH